MTFLNIIEKKFLFSLVRIASLISILILIVALGLAINNYFKGPQADTEVKYSELNLGIVTPDEKHIKSDYELLSLEHEKILHKYMGGENNTAILLSWLDVVPGEYKKNFVDNLAEIIVEAEKNDPTKVVEAINAYQTAKMQKLSSAISPDPAENYRGPIMILFALAALGLIGMFCLILVFLAVERNTRKSES